MKSMSASVGNVRSSLSTSSGNVAGGCLGGISGASDGLLCSGSSSSASEDDKSSSIKNEWDFGDSPGRTGLVEGGTKFSLVTVGSSSSVTWLSSGSGNTMRGRCVWLSLSAGVVGRLGIFFFREREGDRKAWDRVFSIPIATAAESERGLVRTFATKPA